MKKQAGGESVIAFVKDGRAAHDKLRKEVAAEIRAEIKKYGSQNSLSIKLRRSRNYLQETLSNNKLAPMLRAIELIAEHVYGYKA